MHCRAAGIVLLVVIARSQANGYGMAVILNGRKNKEELMSWLVYDIYKYARSECKRDVNINVNFCQFLRLCDCVTASHFI